MEVVTDVAGCMTGASLDPWSWFLGPSGNASHGPLVTAVPLGVGVAVQDPAECEMPGWVQTAASGSTVGVILGLRQLHAPHPGTGTVPDSGVSTVQDWPRDAVLLHFGNLARHPQ